MEIWKRSPQSPEPSAVVKNFSGWDYINPTMILFKLCNNNKVLGHRFKTLSNASKSFLYNHDWNLWRRAFVFCSFYREVSTHLFVKVPRPRNSKVTFRSSSLAATCYYQSNQSKVEAIPLSALPKHTTSELAGLSPH